ncbi:hypothetical protein LGM48_28845 [Burkholderia multivorans]|uniref:hypothetical protein n=1 Tax=Burkholderia multivorans TaxID=87883 RepID=UPI001C2759B5|nr:hypothetical protein [Burkholderia multivorans]MBU9546827.1 hypothetical protein [Burkholderia multivorans]MCA8178323.1 hypothetical protein [Burkholderia multivorans]
MSDFEHSRELQEKFELYLLALIFTILGLAIQIAKFGIYRTADVSQILGWVSLTISGVCGLWRMERIPWSSRLAHSYTACAKSVKN